MYSSPLYILISLIALLAIAALFFLVRRDKQSSRLTPLTSLAFAFVLAGIFLGEDPLLGYILLGIGLLLSVIDIFIRVKKERDNQ